MNNFKVNDDQSNKIIIFIQEDSNVFFFTNKLKKKNQSNKDNEYRKTGIINIKHIL